MGSSIGWFGSSMSVWQNEKFEIAMKNSAWAFTVLDKDTLIGMVRVVSDKVMVAAIQDLIIRENYCKMSFIKSVDFLCRK
jgi:hypothetical protein